MEIISVTIEQRDILLIPFPFSDFSGSKIRPVLVLSKSSFNASSNDIIVCGITTITEKNHYAITVTNKDLEHGQLHSVCTIKLESILRVDKRIIIKKIGKLKENTFSPALEKLHSLF